MADEDDQGRQTPRSDRKRPTQVTVVPRPRFPRYEPVDPAPQDTNIYPPEPELPIEDSPIEDQQ